MAFFFLFGLVFLFCFALLLIQPLHCCTAADRADLIKSIHAMMLRAISVPILAL